MRQAYQKGSLEYLRTKMVDYKDIIDINFVNHKLIVYVQKNYDKIKISDFLEEVPFGIYCSVKVVE